MGNLTVVQPGCISVIIATFNAEKTLEKCIKSVIDQTHEFKELIVIDGESTDGTVDIIKKFESHMSYWVSEADNGVYSAWNKGIRKAKGEWICFIGADDFFWSDGVLAKIEPRLVEAKALGIRYVYGTIARMPITGDEPLSFEGVPWEDARKTYAEIMSVTHSGSFHHRSLFERHGLFDESFRISGDFEFMLRELPENKALFAKDLVTIGMRYGGLTSSIRQKKKAVEEVVRARRKNGRQFSWRVLLWHVRVLTASILQGIGGERFASVIADVYRVATGKKAFFMKNVKGMRR